ncbi:MAG TPA: bifunctional RNase H/acid phosphatase [Kineosporiaceae bacterium]|nr:bifunctional RNase H/acid phosphatase [Kineosporiaceae bacterium]
MTGGRRLVVETDGGSRGNPGPAGFGAVVRDAASGAVLAEVAEAIGVATNNVAEYRGLLAGLAAAAHLDPGASVEVRADSKLVVEQMSGRWQIKHEELRRLAEQARTLLPPGQVTYTWVPRARNTHADRLANEAMDAAAAGKRWSAGAAGNAPAQESVPAGERGAGGEVGAGPVATASTTFGSVRVPRPATGDPTTLLLVRHGRTPLTEAGRFSGRDGEDPPLSAAGEQEAARVAGLVRGLGGPAALLADIARPSAVVCSPMRRTRQTAEAVAAGLGAGTGIDVDGEWIEAGFGVWEGLTYGEIARRHPAELAAWQGSTTCAPPGGESLDDVVERVSAARRRVLRDYSGRCVVVVTHATPVRAVLQDALHAGPAALWRLRVTPASLSVVRYWDDDNAEVAVVNSVAHLAG